MDYISYFNKGISYNEFINLANQFINEGKYAKNLTDYTQLNLQRMKRWDKKGSLDVDIPYTKNLKWLIITEAWCGDSAHSLPFIQKIAEASEIPLKIVLRDENEALMNEFLTNSSKSIPILISLDPNNKVLFRWGPRPTELQEWLIEAKKKNTSQEEIFDYLQKFYNKDAGNTVVREVVDLMK